ncbi:N-formylglutamate amidohydrolase [bacterium]|nr:N-formylglutamate amidohydrolase [bacterium]
MMKPFPMLISIPHGGRKMPPELKERVSLHRDDLFADGDAYTDEIFDLGDRAAHVIKAEIARAFVDLNRAPNDLPPDNTDGVIKSHTCHNRTIYKPGLQPDEKLIEELLDKYYYPYHQSLQSALANGSGNIKLALDCHSMLPRAPEITRSPGRPRPLICLGNRNGKTCSPEWLDSLTVSFQKAFNLDVSDIIQNRPFPGGYITRTYGSKPVPWIQVELNRSMYLVPPYYDRNTNTIDSTRIQNINQCFKQALHLFLESI